MGVTPPAGAPPRVLKVLHVIWWGEMGGIVLNLTDLARHAGRVGHAMTLCVLTRSTPLIDALSSTDVRVTDLGARSGRDPRALLRLLRFLRREQIGRAHV